MKPDVRIGQPLVVAATGEPALYETLGAAFHLESLRPDDEPALEEVHALLDAWIGSELRWSLSTTIGELERFRQVDFEYVTSYPSLLEVEHEDPTDPELVATESYVAGASRTEFGLACKGGDDEAHSSPYTYDFFSEVVDAPADPLLSTCAVLRLTVPLAWPLADFYDRIVGIASRLRLRWGAAGLMYSSWDIDYPEEVENGIYAHARRYSGYDVGFHVTHMADWHDRMRTVSWLTFLGPVFAARLRDAGYDLEAPDASVQVFAAGASTVIRAGAQPDPGDLNWSRLPRSYVIADAMVRSLRAGADKNFYGPWTEATTVKWLKRFEKRLA
jgi:hypothetical protein